MSGRPQGGTAAAKEPDTAFCVQIYDPFLGARANRVLNRAFRVGFSKPPGMAEGKPLPAGHEAGEPCWPVRCW